MHTGMRHAYVMSVVALAVLVQYDSSHARGLPPAPRAMPVDAEMTYHLGVTINGLDRHHIERIQQRNHQLWMQAEGLRKLGIHVPADTVGFVSLDTIPGVSATYDAASQMLHLTVPSEWLPEQHIKGQDLIPDIVARSSVGALFNYDAYYSDPSHGAPSYVSAFTEQRVFSDAGVLSNTGIYTRHFGQSASVGAQRNRYVRYDTSWRYNDQDTMQTYQLGDFVSGSLSWTSSVRMGGARFSRNFSVRPDIVTYPILNFRGDAALPSAVDLFINGAKTSSSELQPGPFTLSNIPYINGAGQATVVTTDALGRQVSTTLPFYVSNTLLAPGLSDFDVSLGKLRRNYGMQSFSYGTTAASGMYRYGVSQHVTLSAHAQAATDLRVVGVGADMGVGVFGTLSVAATKSEYSQSSGQQYVAGYSYYGQQVGVAVQRTQRVGDYTDLTTIDSRFRLARRSDQATGTVSFNAFGTVGAGYFDIRADDGSRTRLLNVSYSRAFFGNSSVYLSANKALGGNDYSAMLQLIIPLNTQGMVNVGVARDTNNRYTQRVNWSRSVPSQGGLGWSMGYSAGSQHDQQASLTWRTQNMQIQGGLYGEQRDYTHWADISGSFIMMDNALFASNQVNDAVVLVNTQGYPDVPVRYENQLMGKTNADGHLLVPWVASYYPATFGIDTLALPANVNATDIERRIAVNQGSGFVLDFGLKKTVSATVTLFDEAGQPIPLGSTVTDVYSGARHIVGWDGQVYFEGLQQQNRLQVVTEDGRQCQAAFSLDITLPLIAQVGPLVCASQSLGETK